MRLFKFGLIVVTGFVVLVGQLSTRPFGDIAIAGVAFAVYTMLGGLIVFRREGHLTGWLLSLLGLTILVADGVPHFRGVSPVFAAWVGSWAWTAVFALYAALALTFPSGHGPTGQSWPARLGRAGLWALPALVFTAAFTETFGGPESDSQTSNPLGFLPAGLGYPALFMVIFILLVGALSLVVKRRRATGIERAQLTWVVFSLVLMVSAVILTFVYVFGSIALGAGDPGDSAWIVAFLGMIVFPTTFGVAVLRYRLFDIDRIVSRTVAYTLLATFLALVFAGAVTLLTSLLPAGSQLRVAGSTLVVAALFNPARRRVQSWVDRRFNRSHYDARRVGDEFAQVVRDEVDMNRIVAGWTAVVSKTVQPATIAVWLRQEVPIERGPGRE